MINKLFLAVFLVLSMLLLVGALTPVDIDSLQISLWLFFVASAAGATYLGRILFRWKTVRASMIFLGLALVLSLARYSLIWGGDWKTQTIIYQNRQVANRFIEYQMQNPGLGGYNQRIVDKTKLLPGISWLKVLERNHTVISKYALDTAAWMRVNIEKNELGLKDI